MKLRVAILSIFAFVLLFSGVQLYSENNQAIEKDLQAKEQAAWQAWKDHDAKVFEPMLPDDAINIVSGSMTRGKQQIMKDFTACTVNNFALSNFAFLWMDKDAVILTYDATQDATCGGKKVPGKVVASSVWQKKGGKWVSPLHQETAAGM